MLKRDYAGEGNRYAQDVVDGKIIACGWVKKCCQRYFRDLKNLKKKGWLFNPIEVWSVCDFLERMPHVEGRWESKTIQLLPWQIFILTCVFGFRNKDGTRRFNYVYIEVARKNGKSTFTSGLALYALTMEGEEGPQIINAAPTGKQARIVFNVSAKMVRKVPMLAEAAGLNVFSQSITCDINNGFIQPINSKGSTQDGLNPHWGILDELHAHKDRELFDVIKSAFGARLNPMLWCITTAGYNLNGICFEQRQVIEKILNRIIEDDSIFGIIFSIDGEDDPFDPACWGKANPSLKSSRQLQKMLSDQAKLAKASPASLGVFKTKHLNLWLGSAESWLNVDKWRALKHDLLLDDFEGEDCWIGVDMSDRDDITAKVYVFFREGTPYLFTRFYLPAEQVLDKSEHVGHFYQAWAEQGHLVLTQGDWISRERIKEDLRDDLGRFNVRYIGFDQFSGAQTIAEDLESDVSGVIQIYPKTAKNFTVPAIDLEARVNNGYVRHDGSPVMEWMVSNAVVTRRVDGSLLPKKPSAISRNKIDGIDAALTALAGALVVVPYEATDATPGFYVI